jgi:hypothetical protein
MKSIFSSIPSILLFKASILLSEFTHDRGLGRLEVSDFSGRTYG